MKKASIVVPVVEEIVPPDLTSAMDIELFYK
jgi:hypothetical protein